MNRYWVSLIVVVLSLACGPAAQQAQQVGGNEKSPKPGGVLVDHRTSEVAERDPTMAELGGITYVTPRAWDSLLDVKSGPDVSFNDWVLLPNR